MVGLDTSNQIGLDIAEHLRSAKTAQELRVACAVVIKNSPHVQIDLSMLPRLEKYIKGAKSPSWEWMFDSRSKSNEDKLFDATLNASLNGGYFYKNVDGKIAQWAVNGSGSQALSNWFEQIKSLGLVPGHDILSETIDNKWLIAISDTMQGQPYLEERLEVLTQFANLDRRKAFNDFTKDVFVDDGMIVDLSVVDRLADIYPAGLRKDPLRKKAILAFLLLAGNLANKGGRVVWDAGFPADYQLPRGCIWEDTITISHEFKRQLYSQDKLLPIESEMVYHLRCATFVVIEALSMISHVPSWLVDGALFMGFRKNPLFAIQAPPPMKVDGSWF